MKKKLVPEKFDVNVGFTIRKFKPIKVLVGGKFKLQNKKLQQEQNSPIKQLEDSHLQGYREGYLHGYQDQFDRNAVPLRKEGAFSAYRDGINIGINVTSDTVFREGVNYSDQLVENIQYFQQENNPNQVERMTVANSATHHLMGRIQTSINANSPGLEAPELSNSDLLHGRAPFPALATYTYETRFQHQTKYRNTVNINDVLQSDRFRQSCQQCVQGNVPLEMKGTVQNMELTPFVGGVLDIPLFDLFGSVGQRFAKFGNLSLTASLHKKLDSATFLSPNVGWKAEFMLSLETNCLSSPIKYQTNFSESSIRMDLLYDPNKENQISTQKTNFVLPSSQESASFCFQADRVIKTNASDFQSASCGEDMLFVASSSVNSDVIDQDSRQCFVGVASTPSLVETRNFKQSSPITFSTLGCWLLVILITVRYWLSLRKKTIWKA